MRLSGRLGVGFRIEAPPNSPATATLLTSLFRLLGLACIEDLQLEDRQSPQEHQQRQNPSRRASQAEESEQEGRKMSRVEVQSCLFVLSHKLKFPRPQVVRAVQEIVAVCIRRILVEVAAELKVCDSAPG